MLLREFSENGSQLDTLTPVDLSGFSRTGFTVVAVCLGIIFVFGFLNNFLVLLVFARFHVLRTPINLILLNISVSDMLVCIFGTPLSFAASVHGRWLTGVHGCRWYGFANALFGKLWSNKLLCSVDYEMWLALTGRYRKHTTLTGLSPFQWLLTCGSRLCHIDLLVSENCVIKVPLLAYGFLKITLHAVCNTVLSEWKHPAQF